MTRNILPATKNGEDVFGFYLSIPNPTLIEICKAAGFDYVRLDMEHSLYSAAEIRECLRTAYDLEIPAWVRVRSLSDITPLLDMGAMGIIVPDIRDKEDVLKAVELVKYAPTGARGMMPNSKIVRFGLDPIADAAQKANDEVVLLVQIESKEALANLDDILTVEGLDMVSMGKQDMAQSLGLIGQAGNPLVSEAENTQIRKTVAAGKCPAPLVISDSRMAAFKEMGVHNFTLGYDVAFLLDVFSNHLNKFKKM